MKVTEKDCFINFPVKETDGKLGVSERALAEQQAACARLTDAEKEVLALVNGKRNLLLFIRNARSRIGMKLPSYFA